MQGNTRENTEELYRYGCRILDEMENHLAEKNREIEKSRQAELNSQQNYQHLKAVLQDVIREN